MLNSGSQLQCSIFILRGIRGRGQRLGREWNSCPMPALDEWVERKDNVPPKAETTEKFSMHEAANRGQGAENC